MQGAAPISVGNTEKGPRAVVQAVLFDRDVETSSLCSRTTA